MKPKSRRQPEHKIQVSIIEWLRWHKFFCFAIPNGGNRNAVTGAILKKEGVLAGCPDLQVILDNGKSIFLEVKTEKGVQQSTQKDFQKELEKRGHEYYIVRSLEDVINILGKSGDRS